jgi:hypothetical protein
MCCEKDEHHSGEPALARHNEGRECGQDKAIQRHERQHEEPGAKEREQQEQNGAPKKRAAEPDVGGKAEQLQSLAAVAPPPDTDCDHMTDEDKRKRVEQ